MQELLFERRFTVDHKFAKPNDVRGLRLMNRCAEEVFRKFSDVVFAIGMSDEFRYVGIYECTVSVGGCARDAAVH